MKLKRGETLIEVVLAVGLAVMVLFALVVLGSASVKTSTSSSRRAQAEKLSSAGIEAVRYFRDSSGFDALADGCYQIDSESASGVSAMSNCESSPWVSISLGGSSAFERSIQISDYGSNTNMKKVTSTTRWIESGGDANGYKQVVIETVLTQW